MRRNFVVYRIPVRRDSKLRVERREGGWIRVHVKDTNAYRGTLEFESVEAMEQHHEWVQEALKQLETEENGTRGNGHPDMVLTQTQGTRRLAWFLLMSGF